MSSGGTASVGGNFATGGISAFGGASTSCGGSSNAGATSSTGSTAASSTAGTTAESSSGGALNTGGMATTGAMAATGGTLALTGATATGGSRATGGATSTGGSNATAGATAAGGATTAGLPQLHVQGNLLQDPNGKTIILRGVDLMDLGYLYYNASQSASGITTRIDQILAAGLQPHVLRMPVYPRTTFNGGSPFYSVAPFPVGQAAPSGTQATYTQDQYLNNILKPAVDYATQKNMYVIIDYHQIDNTSGQSATDATTFWTYMAPNFSNYTNVIYEPFNEPIDTTTSWSTFKTRAQGWVDTIRPAAPNNLIIVPSMSWDQHPGDAADSPLTGTNLMYTAHVYPGNWSQTFQSQVANAVTKVPVFITEWGYVLNGTDRNLGTSDTTWSTTFQALVDGYGASWSAWVTDYSWMPNMFTSSALTTLTDFGTFTENWLAATATSDWVQ